MGRCAYLFGGVYVSQWRIVKIIPKKFAQFKTIYYLCVKFNKVKQKEKMKEFIFNLMVILVGYGFHIFGYGDLGNFVVIVFFAFTIFEHLENIEEKLKK